VIDRSKNIRHIYGTSDPSKEGVLGETGAHDDDGDVAVELYQQHLLPAPDPLVAKLQLLHLAL
jgi:hypothetical protein